MVKPTLLETNKTWSVRDMPGCEDTIFPQIVVAIVCATCPGRALFRLKNDFLWT